MRPVPEDHLRRRDGGARRGFTLTELLVVMAIAAVLAGAAAVSMVGTTQRASREGAAEQVMNLLRQARISAVDGGRGAIVRINPVTKSLYGLSTRVEAAWHFESANSSNVTPGARGMNGTVYPVGTTPTFAQGALGLCLDFDGTNDYVNCGNYPVYNPTRGIRLEAYVKPTSTAASTEWDVFNKIDSITEEGYRLYVTYDDGSSGGRPGYEAHGELYLESSPPATPTTLDAPDTARFPAGSWHHVALEYDGFQSRLLVDGVIVDSTTPSTSPALLTRSGGDLRIGGKASAPTNYFQGRIDEPMLLSVAGGQEVTLPDRVEIVTSEGGQAVHFDAQGNLDIAYHSTPVYVGVGDPYQAAELDDPLPAGPAGTIPVRPRNPFPPAGGTVMVVGTAGQPSELINFDGVSGDLIAVPTRGQYRTVDAFHPDRSPVMFARVVEVSQSGIVKRVEYKP